LNLHTGQASIGDKIGETHAVCRSISGLNNEEKKICCIWWLLLWCCGVVVLVNQLLRRKVLLEQATHLIRLARTGFSLLEIQKVRSTNDTRPSTLDTGQLTTVLLTMVRDIQSNRRHAQLTTPIVVKQSQGRPALDQEQG
jgi:hypothetical protein